jgi:hypothetical protein
MPNWRVTYPDLEKLELVVFEIDFAGTIEASASLDLQHITI